MPTTQEMENAYHLLLTPQGHDHHDCERVAVELQRVDAGDPPVVTRWHDLATMRIPAPVLARCAHLHRHPEQSVAVMRAAADRPLREPDAARVVKATATASIDDVGAWLWRQFPTPIRDQLSHTAEHHTRLTVHLRGSLAVLPWHRLCGPLRAAAGKLRGHRAPAAGRWDVWLRVATDADPTAPARVTRLAEVVPRVLLLVGSQRQTPEVDSAEHDVLAIAKSIHAAGYHCDVAAGFGSLREFPDQQGKWHRLEHVGQIGALIAEHGYGIVHYVGHSDATAQRGWSAAGATTLLFEFELPEDTPSDAPRRRREQPIRIDDFAAALRGRVGLVVLHTCVARDGLAAKLLGAQPATPGLAPAVDAVVSMGAMAPPEVCATFTKTFYRAFADAHSPWLDTAVQASVRALADAHEGLDWLPLLWTRHAARLRHASASTQAIEDYCRAVRREHVNFRGVLAKWDIPFEDVAVDITITRERDGNRRPVLDKPRGPRLQLSDLAVAGQWYTLGGVPGAGKTTMVLRYACALARDRERQHVPVYLGLPAFLRAVDAKVGQRDQTGQRAAAAPLDLAAWLRLGLDPRHPPALADHLADAAKLAGVVFLCDGFDELSPELRTHFTTLLDLLRDRYASCPVLVATRRYETVRFLPRAWFGDADLESLSLASAQRLLGGILAKLGVDATSTAGHAAWLHTQVSERRQPWVEIAGTPLLVSLLALQIAAGLPYASSRLQFFDQAFTTLLQGSHRGDAGKPGAIADAAMPHAAATRRILRYLAWRLTVAKAREVSEAQLRGWLAPRPGTALAPPADVVQALGTSDLWPNRSEPDAFAVHDAAAAFLRCVAERTLILGPGHASPGAPWRFAHKSYQEALCAMYLRERFFAQSGDAAAVAAMLQAFDGWVGRAPRAGDEAPKAEDDQRPDLFEPEAMALARHRRELEALMGDEPTRRRLTAAQLEVRNEAYAAPTLVPAERNSRMWRANYDYFGGRKAWRDYVDVLVKEASLARAGLEAREPFIEAFGLVADELERDAPAIDLDALLTGLLARDWQIAFRAARSARAVPAPCLLELLRALPELAQRAALLQHAAAQCASNATDLRDELLVALQSRAAALGQLVREGSTHRDARQRPRETWDAPGELEVLFRAAGELGATPAAVQSCRLAILDCLPNPPLDELTAQLDVVPGRQGERDPRDQLPGLSLWRYVPAGEFWMGSGGDDAPIDERRHRVAIREPFWIAAVPVTIALYRLFSPAHEVWVGNGYRRVDAEPQQLDPRTAVGCVSYFAAQMFCRWLERHAGAWLRSRLVQRRGGADLPAPARLRVRLPWEAEWEFAARAGTDTRWFFGDDRDQLEQWAWFGKDEQKHGPCAVATQRGGRGEQDAAGANPLGLFDVYGNVWEWCEDWYGDYPSTVGDEPRDGAVGPASGRFRVLRGGSFRDGADFCRSAFRSRFEPDRYGVNGGFRVVVSAAPNLEP